MPKRKTKKTIKKYSAFDLKNPQVVNFFYFFLVFMALIYAGLFWALGEMIPRDVNPSPVVTAQYPTKLETDIKKLVRNHPLEKMAPYIAKEDRRVAGYLVAIAKKESNWGKFSPKKEGKECYNYWGYRGSYNQTDSGYSCFDNPRQAVNVVGERIQELVDQDLDTPKKIVVWKCGWDCSGHDDYHVAKWIQDVDYYYQKIYQEKS